MTTVTRINIISFKDIDVSKPIEDLVTMFPNPYLVFALTDNEVLNQSIMSVIKKHQVKHHMYYAAETPFPTVTTELGILTQVVDPIKEVIKQVQAHDILAIAWDDSLECHEALHAVEDYGVDAWNIDGELELLLMESEEDIDEEDIMDLIHDSISSIVELMGAYVVAKVMRILKEEDDHTGWHGHPSFSDDDEDFEE